MRADRLVAQSIWSAAVCNLRPAAWLPNSAGIVLSGTSVLLAPAALVTAGIAFGTLPGDSLVLPDAGLGFTSDGGYYLSKVRYQDPEQLDDEGSQSDSVVCPEIIFRLFRCTVHGPQVLVGTEPAHEVVSYNMQLVPNSHRYIFSFHDGSTPDIFQEDTIMRDFSDSAFEVHPGRHRCPSVVAARLAFSSSGRLLCDSGHGPRAMDVFINNGDDELAWSMFGEPSSSVELDQHAQLKKSYRCVSWLPSGCGFVYESCDKEEQQSIHGFMFASCFAGCKQTLICVMSECQG